MININWNKVHASDFCMDTTVNEIVFLRTTTDGSKKTVNPFMGMDMRSYSPEEFEQNHRELTVRESEVLNKILSEYRNN